MGTKASRGAAGAPTRPSLALPLSASLAPCVVFGFGLQPAARRLAGHLIGWAGREAGTT